MTNIPLDRTPTIQDYETVALAAQRECECTDRMREELAHGDETICKPCAARQTLNGLTTLAERLKA